MWSDIDGGLFRTLEREGAVESLVTPERIARAAEQPPADTRAYARAHVLRAFGDRVINICERVIYMVTGEYQEIDTLEFGLATVG